MDVVIDAQIVNWYFQETELGLVPECTDSPGDLIRRLGREDIAFVDAGQQIENEWRSVVDFEWFDAWFGDRLINGDVEIIPVRTCAAVIRKLETRCGFPRGSRDRWYVRTATTRAEDTSRAVALVSEDVDLFQPSAKRQHGRRRVALEGCSGPVVRCLRGSNVQVRTIAAHLSSA